MLIDGIEGVNHLDPDGLRRPSSVGAEGLTVAEMVSKEARTPGEEGSESDIRTMGDYSDPGG